MAGLLWALIVFIVIIVIAEMVRMSWYSHFDQQGGKGQDISDYYQQHSYYPTGAWWIPASEPSQKCHLMARTNCHEQYNYDDCYKAHLDQCNRLNPPTSPPIDLISLPVKDQGVIFK